MKKYSKMWINFMMIGTWSESDCRKISRHSTLVDFVPSPSLGVLFEVKPAMHA
jgi:hypothetical protein